MRRSGLLGIDVHGLQLDGVLFGVATRRRGRQIFNLRVSLQYFKCFARKNFRSGSNPLCSIPLLNFPVSEYLIAASGSLRGGASGCRSIIYICVVIRGSTSTSVRIVLNNNAGRAIERCMPLGVDVKLLGNPEAINI